MNRKRKIEKTACDIAGSMNGALQAIGDKRRIAVIGGSDPLRVSCNKESYPVLASFKDHILCHLNLDGVNVAQTNRWMECDDGFYFEIW